MSIFGDIIKGLPVNAVLREKIEAIEAKQAALETENAILKDDKRELEAENKRLKEQIDNLTRKADLHQLAVRILRELEKGKAYVYPETVALLLGENQTIVEYFMLELLKDDFVSVKHNPDSTSIYGLAQKGRAYLIDNKLIPPGYQY